MSTSCNLFSKLSFVIFVVCRVSTLKRGRTTKKFPTTFAGKISFQEELLNISDVPFSCSVFSTKKNLGSIVALALLCDTQTIIHQNEGH